MEEIRIRQKMIGDFFRLWKETHDQPEVFNQDLKEKIRKGRSQVFWLTLLTEVFGVDNPYTTISFENQVMLTSRRIAPSCRLMVLHPTSHSMNCQIAKLSCKKCNNMPYSPSNSNFSMVFVLRSNNLVSII